MKPALNGAYASADAIGARASVGGAMHPTREEDPVSPIPRAAPRLVAGCWPAARSPSASRRPWRAGGKRHAERRRQRSPPAVDRFVQDEQRARPTASDCPERDGGGAQDGSQDAATPAAPSV